MSEVRGDCATSPDLPHGHPQVEQPQLSAPGPDKRKNPCSFCLQNSTHNSNFQRDEEVEALKLLSSEIEENKTFTNREIPAAPGAITCQPQTRSSPPSLGLSSSTDHSRLVQNSNNGASDRRSVKSGLGSGLISARNSQKLQPSLNSQSSKRSKPCSKSSSSQIPKEVRQDCCVHCILACLFCEFWLLCNIVLDCVTCGSCSSDESCFCCCCDSGECADCDLPCDLDCGIVDACCESADCLEICMECCELCFSS